MSFIIFTYHICTSEHQQFIDMKLNGPESLAMLTVRGQLHCVCVSVVHQVLVRC